MKNTIILPTTRLFSGIGFAQENRMQNILWEKTKNKKEQLQCAF